MSAPPKSIMKTSSSRHSTARNKSKSRVTFDPRCLKQASTHAEPTAAPPASPDNKSLSAPTSFSSSTTRQIIPPNTPRIPRTATLTTMGANMSKRTITITERIVDSPPPPDVYYVERRGPGHRRPLQEHNHHRHRERCSGCHRHRCCSAPAPQVVVNTPASPVSQSQQIIHVPASPSQQSEQLVRAPVANSAHHIIFEAPQIPVELVAMPMPPPSRQLSQLSAPHHPQHQHQPQVTVSFQPPNSNHVDGGQVWNLGEMGLPFSLVLPAGTVVSRDGVRLVNPPEQQKRDEGILAIRFSDGTIRHLKDPQGNWVRKGYEGYVTVEGVGTRWVYITRDMDIKSLIKT